MLINKNFFFKHLKNFKGNKLADYLKHLSKTNSFTGKYYSNKFSSDENKYNFSPIIAIFADHMKGSLF